MERAPRVCLVSEALGLPGDEGVRQFARSLLDALHGLGPAWGLPVGHGRGGKGAMARFLARSFLDRHLAQRLRALAPDLVVYLPSAAATVFSLWRARVLRALCPGARVALIALQPRRLGLLSRLLGRALRPTVAFAQAPWTMAPLWSLGCSVRFLPSGVDVQRFRPVSPDEKERLRHRHGLPRDEFLLLHVGHLKEGRNLQALRWAVPWARPVLVAAASMGRDDALADFLVRETGAIVIDGYQPCIEELYQASDCYIFPVERPDNAIDVPLSVLEAMACDLPVLTYPYGGLPLMFQQGYGLRYVTDWRELPRLLDEAHRLETGGTRRLVLPYTWEEVARRLLAQALEVEGP